MLRSNLEMIQVVAAGLAGLKEQVVFVGGAVAELYAQNSGAAPVRPTMDVDLILKIVSKPEFASMENQLRELGFSNDFSENAPICRWLYQGIQVDVMPTETHVLGFSNEWYRLGYERRIAVELPTSGPIYILSPAHYLCTKLSATKSRGYPDLLVSHDLEDVVYLISNCRDLIEDARTADDSVKTYIRESFQELRANPNFEEAISYSLPYGEADRLGLIQNRVDQLLALVERSA